MTSSVQSGASRAIIRQKIENKRLLEKASLRAVEALLEEGITEEILRLQCRYLWQNTYQDCAEERAVGRLCGYPLCDNAITAANRTGPRYKICTRRNKVYDLEKRRIFCSDWCYAASEWLKSQLSEVPLWMHEKLPEDACLDLLRKELAPCATKKEHAASLADMSSTSMAENDIYDSADFMFSPRGKRRPTSEIAREREETERETFSYDGFYEDAFETSAVGKDRFSNTVEEHEPSGVNHLALFSVKELEKILCEWITITTLYHIVGRERFLEIRAEFDHGTVGTSACCHESFDFTIRYQRLCRFLDEQAKLEGLDDTDDEQHSKPMTRKQRSRQKESRRKTSVCAEIEHSSDSTNVLHPPKSQSENVSLVAGPSTVSLSTCPNTPLEPTKLDGLSVVDDFPDPILPQIEKHEKHAARKQILLDRVTPVIEESMASYIGLPPLQLARDLSQLVDTFHLTSENCMPPENAVIPIALTLLMLTERRAGGEGSLPESLRNRMIEPLHRLDLGFSDLRMALKLATDPKRLFACHDG